MVDPIGWLHPTLYRAVPPELHILHTAMRAGLQITRLTALSELRTCDLRNTRPTHCLCGHLGHVMTADCRDDKDIKKQFMRQNAVGNIQVRKISFAPIEAKIRLFKSYCYPIYGCAHWRHSYQNSIRKLTVSFSDTFKRLINVPRYTSSSLAFAMNLTDHIIVVFRKFACSVISRVTASPNSSVSAIVNSDAYHQSPLIDKWESML